MNAPTNDLIALLKASDAFIEQQNETTRAVFFAAVEQVKRADPLPKSRRRVSRLELLALAAVGIVILVLLALLLTQSSRSGITPPATNTVNSTAVASPTATATVTSTPTHTRTATRTRTVTPTITPTIITATATFRVFIVPTETDTPTGTKTSTADSSASAQVVSGSISAKSAKYSGACPIGIAISGQLNTLGGGLVTYRWERSDGKVSQPVTANVTESSGKLVVSTVSQVSSSGSYVETLRILMSNQTPTQTTFSAPYSVVCTSKSQNQAPNQLPQQPAQGPTTPAPQQQQNQNQQPPPPENYTVTGVGASVKPSKYTGACPTTFNFSGDIVANGPVSVSYRWERSDGATGPTQGLNANAGDNYVGTSWTLGDVGQYSGYYVLHVLSPVEMYSGQAAFFADCQQTPP